MEEQEIGGLMQAARDNTHKPDPMTIHPIIFSQMKSILEIELFMEAGTPGAKKYDVPNNTRLNYMIGGKSELEYIQSAMRHLMQDLQGIERDPETGARHLAHVYWNLSTLRGLRSCGRTQKRLVPSHIEVLYSDTEDRGMLSRVHLLGFVDEESFDKALDRTIIEVLRYAREKYERVPLEDTWENLDSPVC